MDEEMPRNIQGVGTAPENIDTLKKTRIAVDRPAKILKNQLLKRVFASILATVHIL